MKAVSSSARKAGSFFQTILVMVIVAIIATPIVLGIMTALEAVGMIPPGTTPDISRNVF